MDSALEPEVTTNETRQEHEREDCRPCLSSLPGLTAPVVSLFNSDSSGSAPTSRPSAASMTRRARKGFGMTGSRKKRLMLRIEGESARASSSTLDSSIQNQAQEAQNATPGDDVPWWKVEYQQPPPGHLGAHILPVADATIEGSTLSASNNVEEELTPTASDVSPGTRKRELTTHETPERAHRRARADDRTVFSLIPSLQVDSSPTQKRKICHLVDRGTRDLLGGEVGIIAKEQKLFHEVSREPTTPSRLVQPMTAIEIAGQCEYGKQAGEGSREES